MKKLIILLLLYIISFTSINAVEKESMYLAEKKDPAISLAFSFILPSAGHLYSGDWGRGAGFLAGEIILLYFFNEEYQKTKDSDDPDAALSDNGKWFALGFLGLKAWEMIDAFKAAEDYNMRLKQKYGISMDLNVSGATVAAFYKF